VERYKLNRIGIYNYWYYDYEEFYFKEGKLFLRGGNGAGKSVTMQTFITFLLDGNKSPHRLDPFGSRDRKMKDLLVGEKKISKIEDRIGYVFMEFIKRKTKQYITVGYGLEARKDKAELHDDWGFVITNSFTRIGKNEDQFKLYKEEKVDGELREFPLNKSEFKKALGENGFVTESRREYLKKVNTYLFGFPSEEYLEKYTELLWQLKSPKLSKEFNPDTVCDILTSSLPSLTKGELEPLAESVENMNQIEEDIRILRAGIQSVNRINHRYDKYNEVKLYDVANKLIDSHRYVENKKQEKCYKEESLKQKNARHSSLDKEISKNQNLEHKYRQEEESLRQHEIHGIKSKLIQVQNDITKEKQSLETKEGQLDTKKGKEREIESKIKGLQYESDKLTKDIQNAIQDIEYDAEQSKFDLQHENHSSHFKREYQSRSYDFSFWISEAKEYKEKISGLLELLRKYELIRDQLKQIRTQIENKNDTLSKERKELLDLENQCEEVRGDLEEDVIAWIESLELLELEHREKEEILRMVNKVLTSVKPYDYQNYVNEHVAQKTEQFLSEKTTLEHQHKELEAGKNEKEIELQQIKDSQEIEPEWHEDKRLALQELKEQNVPFLPFYEAVEFKEGISDDAKRKIESVMIETGLLTSVIVPENYEWLVEQKLVLLRNTGLKENNLLSYLLPIGNESVSNSDIEKVLASISVEEDVGNNYILLDGRFQNGFVKGISSSYGEAKYIGKLARERERERKISELSFEIEVINESIERVRESIEEVIKKVQMLKAEHQSFPQLTVLQEAYDSYDRKKKFIDLSIRPEIERLEEDEELKKIESEGSMKDIRANSDFVELQLDKSVFELAVKHLAQYIESMIKMQSDYKILVMTLNAIYDHQEQKVIIVTDVDHLSYEVAEIKDTKEKLLNEKQSLENQLTLGNAAEIEERIGFVVGEINRLPNEREILKDERSNIASDISTLKEEIILMNKTISFDECLVEMWKERFLNEHRLGYVLVESPKQDPIELVKDLISQLEEIIGEEKRKDEDLDRYRERVESSFENVVNNELANLNEYNLSRPIELMYDGEMPEPLNEYQEAQIEIFKNMRNRYKLTLEFEKKKHSSYEVRNKLVRNLEISEESLTQKERELFEEELIAHIGGIIRERIHDAEYWIKEMNEFMEETSETTGILFQMRWIANKSDNEGEMNTKPLVDALKKDPVLLTQKEKERIAKHFHVKIKKAIQDGEQTKKSLYDVLKEELDYRKWYTFQMYWQKSGEGEVDLTRLGTTQFKQSSGGEKALTMYTPLLSAVHSRLSEAADDAPRIISLDEAFAGVDESKIEGMFKLVEDLDFDYIMNSQFLWGTYKTVTALSIVDLNRPGNVPYVNAEKYEWDGRNKVYLGEVIKEEIDKKPKSEQVTLQLG
jgi:uncharacterized protein (TIGR02680 family)